MTRDEFLQFHSECLAKMADICKRKNADYAGAREGQDAFANFRAVEHLGISSVEVGMLTRMTDKVSRLASYASTGKLQVMEESIEDTLIDLANYALLMAGYLRSKKLSKGIAGLIPA